MNLSRSEPLSILDLFAGPGGWDVALKRMGLDPLGVEWDDAACATREAAGLRTIQGDVAALNPDQEAFWATDLLIASPPCQAWSMAGKRLGEKDKQHVIACAHELALGNDTRAEHGAECEDNRSMLVVEPLRFIRALKPAYVALEQVPPVLELWTLFATFLEQWGYGVWTGVLEAERYGVPQTRERAILIASLNGPVAPPEPTHQRYIPGEPQRHDITFDGEVLPWVSMAEALGWTGTLRTGDNTMKHSRDPQDMVPYERDVETPAPTVDTKGTWKHGEEHTDPPMRWKVQTHANTRAGEAEHRQRPNGVEFDPDERPSPTVDSTSGRWEGVNVPAPIVTAGGTGSGGPEPFGRGGRERIARAQEMVYDTRYGNFGDYGADDAARPMESPAPTLSAQGLAKGRDVIRPKKVYVNGNQENVAKRPEDTPAPTLLFGHRMNDVVWESAGDPLELKGDDWPEKRPSTTVAGDQRIFQPGGHHGEGEQSKNAVRVTEQEAAILQSFPPDYPFQGSRSKRFEQIGNAVPPLLAEAVLRALLDMPEEGELAA